MSKGRGQEIVYTPATVLHLDISRSVKGTFLRHGSVTSSTGKTVSPLRFKAELLFFGWQDVYGYVKAFDADVFRNHII